jgi:predicted secreted protein
MQILKVCALTTSGLILWLAPPFTLSRKIPLHNWVTGLSLMGGFACCFESRRLALKLAQTQEFESKREAVIVADAVDELATSAYVSEQQRRIKANSILDAADSEQIEHLERSLAISHESEDWSSSERSVQLAENADSELRERILQLQAKGYGKAKIILELWGVTKGGSPKYKAAEAEYKRLVGE